MAGSINESLYYALRTIMGTRNYDLRVKLLSSATSTALRSPTFGLIRFDQQKNCYIDP